MNDPTAHGQTTLPDLVAIKSLLKTAREYHFADVLDAAWGLLREVESLRQSIAAIRREVGADERCTSCGGRAPDSQHGDRGHVHSPETTLAAVQRAMKERMTDEACVDLAKNLATDLPAILAANGAFPVTKNAIALHEDRWLTLIRQARGGGA